MKKKRKIKNKNKGKLKETKTLIDIKEGKRKVNDKREIEKIR